MSPELRIPESITQTDPDPRINQPDLSFILQSDSLNFGILLVLVVINRLILCADQLS